MSLCFKCNKSIKPASLATTVKGERYHPTCLFCSICERPLWGRPFKKSSDGSLVCDQFCEPQDRPVSVDKKSITSRPSSAQKQQQILIEQAKQNADTNKQHLDLEKYRKPLLAAKITENKVCHACDQKLTNKRFITFENGEMICQDCEDRMKNPVMAQTKSGNSVECFICRKTVQGSKYITEKNGDVICENCELNGARCDKCNQLFRPNEVIRRLNFDIKYHDHCFNCKSCHKLIHSEQFFLDESKKFPICSDCEQLSKLPKCTVCNIPINGPHLIFDGKPVHDLCLKCSGCGKNLDNDGGGYFKDKNCGLPLCFDCNLERYGKKCAKCFQVIEKDGLTFADKDYHIHCFTCQSCGTDLTKMKKTLTDKEGNALYCEPCFINQFAPRCNKCSEPIPPYLSGTVYEEKNFHKECFSCARCKRTLANKKFFKSGNILVCEACF